MQGNVPQQPTYSLNYRIIPIEHDAWFQSGACLCELTKLRASLILEALEWTSGLVLDHCPPTQRSTFTPFRSKIRR